MIIKLVINPYIKKINKGTKKTELEFKINFPLHLKYFTYIVVKNECNS